MGVAEEPVVRLARAPVGAPTVAHVLPEYLPRSATFVHTLLTHQTRFRPLVLAQALSNLEEFPVERVREVRGEAGVRAKLLALRTGASPLTRSLVAALRDGQPALVHAHFGWSGRDAVDACARRRLPLVTTFYGRDLSEGARGRRDPYRRLFSTARAFVVEGPHMASALADVGCPAGAIRVIPIGIDLEALAFSPACAGETFVAVQTARFVEKKGVDLTVRAFAAARRELGPSELRLVGDGPLRPAIERLVEELGLGDVVRLHGMLSQAEYRRLVRSADVLVQPSRTARDGDSEGGAPTVVLEMQAIGVRVVSTRHADIPFVAAAPDELVAEEDVDGLAEALVRVRHESRAERHARLVAAREFVEARHDAVVVAAAVEDLYEELLG